MKKRQRKTARRRRTRVTRDLVVELRAAMAAEAMRGMSLPQVGR
jgi:hypothetical protein